MKKTILLLLLIAFSWQADAQNIYYFETDNKPYQPLNGQGVLLNGDNIWDEPQFAIPLGFEFFLFDAKIDTLFTGDGIGAFLHNKPKPEFVDSNSNRFVVPYETDLQDRGAIAADGKSQSPIVFRWEGFPGQRIFKLEWANAGFFDEREELGTMNDFVNIQIWLYEATSIIEFRYGPSKITTPAINFYGLNGPTIGIMSSILSLPIVLVGDPQDPDLTNNLSQPVGLDSTPANGTVYRFTPDLSTLNLISSVQKVLPSFKIIQNNSQQFLYVFSEKPQTLNLYNISGQILDTKTIQGSQQWDIAHLSSGMYLLQDENGATLRFLK